MKKGLSVAVPIGIGLWVVAWVFLAKGKQTGMFGLAQRRPSAIDRNPTKPGGAASQSPSAYPGIPGGSAQTPPGSSPGGMGGPRGPFPAVNNGSSTSPMGMGGGGMPPGASSMPGMSGSSPANPMNRGYGSMPNSPQMPGSSSGASAPNQFAGALSDMFTGTRPSSNSSGPLHFTGRLQAEESVPVYPGIEAGMAQGQGQPSMSSGFSATVDHVYVREGTSTSKGQILCTLKVPDAALRLKQAEERLESAKRYAAQNQNRPMALPDVAGAQRRVKDLEQRLKEAEAKTPAPPDVDNLRKEKQQAEEALSKISRIPLPQQPPGLPGMMKEQVEAAQRNVEQLRKSLGRLTVRSPISGRAFAAESSSRPATAGGSSYAGASPYSMPMSGYSSSGSSYSNSPFLQSANPFPHSGQTVAASTPLFIVASGRVVQGALDETAIVQVEVGCRAKVVAAALPKLHLTGKVTRIGYVGQSTGASVSYPVTVKVFGNSNKLRLGMNLDVTMEKK
ncbi:MAG: biotin/lipoyl-binding protein [Armatimonadetes bacterium]|nr:biotin/lipoyl-binding protein [Armatimonadota bacterium]